MQYQSDILDWLKEKDNLRPHIPPSVQIEELLAEGGQGIVYRGRVDALSAAIKIYFPGQVQERIEREVQSLKDLDSPSIVRLLWWGSFEVQNERFQIVATSLVPGVPLDKFSSKKKQGDKFISAVAYDVADAIESMWKRRIVHRDLKPSNIMIKPDNRACVIDLGLARHLDLSSLTATGATWGTLGYLSPEQTRGVKQLTCKSDIFALGVILVECSLGRHPTRRDQLRLLAMRLHENLPDEINSWEHASVLRSMLDPRPTRRPKPTHVLEKLRQFAPT